MIRFHRNLITVHYFSRTAWKLPQAPGRNEKTMLEIEKRGKEPVKKPLRYDTGKEGIDNFGRAQIGKSIIVTMRGGRIESGILRGYGEYDIAMELSNKKVLIVMKHAIDTVVVL